MYEDEVSIFSHGPPSGNNSPMKRGEGRCPQEGPNNLHPHAVVVIGKPLLLQRKEFHACQLQEWREIFPNIHFKKWWFTIYCIKYNKEGAGWWTREEIEDKNEGLYLGVGGVLRTPNAREESREAESRERRSQEENFQHVKRDRSTLFFPRRHRKYLYIFSCSKEVLGFLPPWKNLA